MLHPKRESSDIDFFVNIIDLFVAFAHCSRVDRISQAKLLESEKKQGDSLALQALNVFDEYTCARDRLRAKQKADSESHSDLNSRLHAQYLSTLKQAIDRMCDRMDSSREREDVDANEIINSIEELLTTDYGHIHDKEHVSPDSDEVCCSKNNTRSASAIVTSIEERVTRINSMLYNLKLMATDAANGNQEISSDQMKALLQKLLNHRCQLSTSKKVDCDDQRPSKDDILSLTNQLMQLDEPHGKYERERKEASHGLITKLSKARSVVEKSTCDLK